MLTGLPYSTLSLIIPAKGAAELFMQVITIKLVSPIYVAGAVFDPTRPITTHDGISGTGQVIGILHFQTQTRPELILASNRTEDGLVGSPVPVFSNLLPAFIGNTQLHLGSPLLLSLQG